MSRILPRFYARQQETERARRIARITQTAATTSTADATLPGDPVDIRGIPAVARGVPGVSPGTDPLAATLKAERDRERNQAA
jgi:hypothetical protein